MSEREWQPIQTALKNTGRRKVIDVWCVTDDPASALFYFGATCSGVKDRQLWQGRVSEVYWRDGAWRPVSGLQRHQLTVTPTHWMPLPDPPAADRTIVAEAKRAEAAEQRVQALKAANRRMFDGILRCIDAGWRPDEARDWSRPELVLAEYVGELRNSIAALERENARLRLALAKIGDGSVVSFTEALRVAAAALSGGSEASPAPGPQASEGE